MNTKSVSVGTKRVHANGLILAIDLGKYKSVACIYERAEASWQLTSFTTNRAELVKVLDKHPPSVVVIEACALCCWVRDLCVERGVSCKVANTTSEAWKFKHSKRKTDKDDALRLAQLEALGQLPTVAIPPKATREWRALIACRQTLVGRRVAVQGAAQAGSRGLGAEVVGALLGDVARRHLLAQRHARRAGGDAGLTRRGSRWRKVAETDLRRR